jgi:hypothetical protein
MLRNLSPINSDSYLNDSFFSDDEDLKNLTLFEKLEHKEKKHTKTDYNDIKINLKQISFDKISSEKNGLNFFEKEKINTETKFSTKYNSNHKNHKNKNSFLESPTNLQINFDDKNFENFFIGNSENLKDDSNNFCELNINANDNRKNNILIGKKRKSYKIDIQTKEDIYKDIKNLYDEYNKKYIKGKENIPSYKIFEGSTSLFDKHSTIVESKIPGCVIYMHKNKIQSLYLIREQKTLVKDDEIEEILLLIRDNMIMIS